MTRHDPFGARNELRERIRVKLVNAEPGNLVEAIMSLFYEVYDDWDHIEVTTLGESGESFIENRFLVARVPVQGVAWSRPVDRTVGEGGT